MGMRWATAITSGTDRVTTRNSPSGKTVAAMELAGLHLPPAEIRDNPFSGKVQHPGARCREL